MGKIRRPELLSNYLSEKVAKGGMVGVQCISVVGVDGCGRRGGYSPYSYISILRGACEVDVVVCGSEV
jgi:hypothetical protein